MKFTRKRIRIITERPLEVLFPAIRSLAGEDEQGKGASQNLAMWVIGGEKGEVRELEGTTAHL